MNKEIIKKAGLLLGGLAIGSGVTYFLTKRQMTKYYENLIENELAQIKQDYADIQRRETYVSPAEAVADRIGPDSVIFDEAETVEAIIEKGKYAVLPDLIEHNIFVNGTPINPEEHNNDYVAVVDPDGPYVISTLLYHDHDPEFDKITLTYYSGDDTMADDSDQIVTDVDGIIGNVNLSKFGEGSNDPDIVYVRNENLGADMEIIRNEGTFTELVLGVHPQPKVGPRKMREGDDE